MGLLKKAHMVRKGFVDKARRLREIHRFMEITMQEGILDIKLMDGPCLRGGNTEHDMDSSGFDHRAEGFIIVHTLTLGEATHHPTCFVACQRTVHVELVVKDPFPRDHIDTCRLRHQRPRRVVH